MAKKSTYECRQCGTKVVVTETLGTDLRPVYCCGMEMAEVPSVDSGPWKSKAGTLKTANGIVSTPAGPAKKAKGPSRGKASKR